MGHTPGQWIEFVSDMNKWIGNADTGEIICDRPHINYCDDRIDVRWKSNAPLLAGAPELYALLARLEDALLRLPALPDTIALLDMEQIRNALARAKGDHHDSST